MGKFVNHKRVERLMKQEGIRSNVAKNFKIEQIIVIALLIMSLTVNIFY